MCGTNEVVREETEFMPLGTQGDEYTGGRHAAQKKRRRGPIIAVLVLVIVACLSGAGFGVYTMLDTTQQIQSAQNEEKLEPAVPSVTSEPAQKLAKNPINFDEVRAQNEDIYAWIYVPGTNVNHAVVQHPSDNAFYLTHDETKAENEFGAVFTEDFNTKDFKDAVTMVYGHNIRDGLVFSTLHYFEDPEFFDQNDKFYVYMPGHILTYEIVSAFTTDDRHVLYRYNYFQTYDELRAFEQEVLDPHSIQQNTREVELDDSSKLVVMSTCNSGALEEHGRYLVCGVLTDDQPTE